MKLIRSAIMAALAKKVFDEARKPQNQQKIKDVMAQMSSRAKNSQAKNSQARRPAR